MSWKFRKYQPRIVVYLVTWSLCLGLIDCQSPHSGGPKPKRWTSVADLADSAFSKQIDECRTRSALRIKEVYERNRLHEIEGRKDTSGIEQLDSFPLSSSYDYSRADIGSRYWLTEIRDTSALNLEFDEAIYVYYVYNGDPTTWFAFLVLKQGEKCQLLKYGFTSNRKWNFLIKNTECPKRVFIEFNNLEDHFTYPLNKDIGSGYIVHVDSTSITCGDCGRLPDPVYLPLWECIHKAEPDQ